MKSKMRPLVIDDTTRAQIKQVVDYAENHPLTRSYVEGIAEGRNPPPGDNPEYRCMLSYMGKPGTGYSCVYTIDQSQNSETGEPVWLRHLSVAVDLDGSPQPIAIDMLMQEFGFKERLCNDDGSIRQGSAIQVWMEGENDPDSSKAINVVELYDDTEEEKENQSQEDQGPEEGEVQDSP